jgi:S-adenosylmethionine-diacylgycerolhomoserine-N-methlytransferase
MTAISSAELMNRQYRFQRHIYDYTRTHYLFWRRRLIADLKPPRDGTIVEVACGTGWNLLRAAETYPAAQLYGFDISREMLATSRRSVRGQGFETRVALAEGDATNFNLAQMFGIHSADRIFISYALSMIPDWSAAVERAVAQLAPGGQLHIVDFGRMDKMPAVPRATFLRFLAHYNVTPRRDLEAVLLATAQRNGLSCTFEEMRSGYSAYAVLKRPGT